jgi:hypothetical protein
MGGAQAADLPVKAKAVEYVRICSLYGAGFYYIPGTDTCIRIGGAIRLDVAFNAGIYDNAYMLGNGQNTSQGFGKNWYADRARFNLTEDTRTATEYGVLRTYANVQMDWTGNTGSAIAGGAPVEVDYAFMQFAGFTLGKAVSQFDSQWVLSKPTISSGVFSGSNNATGLPQLAYTATFGNGVSGTISLEDAQPYRTAGLVNVSQASLNQLLQSAPAGNTYGVGNFTGNSVAGNHVPDVVGNLRLDQAWGSLHFGAAAHEVHGNYYGVGAATATNAPQFYFSDNGHVPSTYGYAVTGAFELKNLPTGAGDTFRAEATFGHGAAKYVFAGTVDGVGAGRFLRASGTDPGTVAIGYVLDGVYQNGSTIALTNAWEVDAWFEHYWTPQWRTSLYGGYSKISYGGAGGAASALLFQGLSDPTRNTATGWINAGTSNGNMDFAIAQVGTKTSWMPVKDLTFSFEFIYSRLMPSLTGTFTNSPTPYITASQPGSVYTIGSQNIFNGAVQAIRSF